MKKAFWIIILVLAVFTLPFITSPNLVAAEPLSLLIPPPTPAVEYSLPYPGILPDHPLYFIKVLRDKILLFLTHDAVKKTNISLLLSDKRIVMGKLLWEKGNTDLSVSTFTKGEKYLLEAAILLIKLKKNNNLPPGLADKIELAAKKHEEIIMNLMSGITDENRKQGLNQALGVNHQAAQQIQLAK